MLLNSLDGQEDSYFSYFLTLLYPMHYIGTYPQNEFSQPRGFNNIDPT